MATEKTSVNSVHAAVHNKVSRQVVRTRRRGLRKGSTSHMHTNLQPSSPQRKTKRPLRATCGSRS